MVLIENPANLSSQSSSHEDIEVVELEELAYLNSWLLEQDNFDTIVSHCQLGNFNNTPHYDDLPDEATEFLKTCARMCQKLIITEIVTDSESAPSIDRPEFFYSMLNRYHYRMRRARDYY